MPGNRVDQLETKVQELEATVEGLTEELVEANERIRQLEEALGGDGETTADEPASTGFDDADAVDSDEGVAVDADDDGEELELDLAAGADPEEVEQATSEVVGDDRSVETHTSDDDESGDEGDADDIIVA